MKGLKRKIEILFDEVYKNVKEEDIGNEVLSLKEDVLVLIKSRNRDVLKKAEAIKVRLITLPKMSLKLRLDRNLDLIFAYFLLWEDELKFKYENLPLLELGKEEKSQCTELHTAIIFALKCLRIQIKSINDAAMLHDFEKLRKNIDALISDKISYEIRAKRILNQKRVQTIGKQLNLLNLNENKKIEFLRRALAELYIRTYLEYVISFWAKK